MNLQCPSVWLYIREYTYCIRILDAIKFVIFQFMGLRKTLINVRKCVGFLRRLVSLNELLNLVSICKKSPLMSTENMYEYI